MVWRKSRAWLGHSSISLQETNYRKTKNPATWLNSMLPSSCQIRSTTARLYWKTEPFHFLSPVFPFSFLLWSWRQTTPQERLKYFCLTRQLSQHLAWVAHIPFWDVFIMHFLSLPEISLCTIIKDEGGPLHYDISWTLPYLPNLLLHSSAAGKPWNLSGNSPVVVR